MTGAGTQDVCCRLKAWGFGTRAPMKASALQLVQDTQVGKCPRACAHLKDILQLILETAWQSAPGAPQPKGPSLAAGAEPACCCVKLDAQLINRSASGFGGSLQLWGSCCYVESDAQPIAGLASGFGGSPTTTGAPTASRPGLIISLRALAATMLTQRAYSGFSAYVMIPGCSRNWRRTYSMHSSALH